MFGLNLQRVLEVLKPKQYVILALSVQLFLKRNSCAFVYSLPYFILHFICDVP